VASSVTVKVRDSGQLKLLAGLRMSITGGVHEDTGFDTHGLGPLDVYEVAAVNEFGGGNIPSRPWLRGWVTRNQARVVASIKRAMLTMVSTQKFSVAPFSDIANHIMLSLRERITSGKIKPANAPSTLARKAPETRPLYDQGELVGAIHGRVTANNGWKAEHS